MPYQHKQMMLTHGQWHNPNTYQTLGSEIQIDLGAASIEGCSLPSIESQVFLIIAVHLMDLLAKHIPLLTAFSIGAYTNTKERLPW